MSAKFHIISISFFLIPFILQSQTEDFSYTSVTDEITGSKPRSSSDESSFFWGGSFDYAVYRFSNILQENLNNKLEIQRIEREQQRAMAKLAIIKNHMAQYSVFPDRILDGWHSAVATDNLNFCNDLKVLVQDNKIVKVVIENYLSIGFRATGEINKTKTVLSLTNYGGEQLSIVELYFMYDMEEPAIVDEPISPGYVCFWSDLKNYSGVEIWINNEVTQDKFQLNYQSTPDCFENGMICKILKPGMHGVEIYTSASKLWSGSIEVKENMCLKIRCGKKMKE